MSGIIAAIAAAAVAGNVVVLEEVGDIAVQCGGDQSAYMIDAENKRIELSAGDETQVALHRMTGEFVWYCGDKQMRTGSKDYFNAVRAERDDSEVTWTFLIDWSR